MNKEKFDKAFNNFMHKVIVPLQYGVAVVSMIIQLVYNLILQLVDIYYKAFGDTLAVFDDTLRKIGTGFQKANQIMKEALLKDYTKQDNDNE